MRIARNSTRVSLLCAASALGFLASAPAFAQASDSNVISLDEQIVAHHLVPLGPGSTATGAAYANSDQVLSTGVNGIGQQIAFIQPANSPNGASLSLCSGTLINPRTLITAAHCLHARPAHMYGSQTGTGGGAYGSFGPTQGVPISYGFNATNRCLGVAVNGCAVGQGAYETWRDSGFKTNVALNIYNANQVWYNNGAQPVALGGGGEFANGDIALVTFDTHVKGIPTWALLFSPLDGPTHTTITGYGGTGVGLAGIGSLAGIDYRRRAVENMIDGLMSIRDAVTSPAFGQINPAYGPGSTQYAGFDHTIYWLDFDDPTHDPDNLPASFFNNTAGAGQRNNGYYDFNGLGGGALPNEGSTAGGDSGGPLIVDQRWDRQVVAGVLTGSFSFNGGLSTYGQFNVYPPLFHFWEELVQNNPYVYASAKAGNGDWHDPTHWVQDMDPNYVVIGADGQLVNTVPDTNQGGADGSVQRFGEMCWVGKTYCKEMVEGETPTGDGTPVVTAGGPGSTNFVPDNVEPVNSATPGATVKARYYDVTLREAGKTTLSGSATIDMMTVNGPAARLDIANGGNLTTWADFTQIAGWTNVDGALNTNEMLVVSGLLTGKGTITADALTVAAGIVAPGGGDKTGTLTVNGDVVLASASSLFVDVMRGSADKLAVDGSLSLSNADLSGGASIVFNKVTDGAAPRQNETFTIATASDGVIGKFGTAYTFQGVLRPDLNYTATDVKVKFVAGKFVEILDGGSAVELAFASALDQLRAGSYNSLWNLYGSIDWMNGTQLSAAFAGLTPRVLTDVGAFHDHQSKLLTSTVTDRLSLLGSGKAQGLTVTGSPLAAFAARNGSADGRMSYGTSSSSNVSVGELPGKLSGFVSGGMERTRSSYGDASYAAGQGAWHMATGLEMPLGEGMIGTAAGYAEGASTPGGDSNRSRTTMAAAYAAAPVGSGFYVGGMLSAETARASMERGSHDGVSALRLSGATNAERYSAVAEAGRVTKIGSGLTLTPRAQLAYGRYKLEGFEEQGGETALRIDDVTAERVEARLGAKLEGSTSFAGFSIKPQISADYVSLLSGRETGATVRFAAAPDVGIALPLSSSASGWAEVKGGVMFGDGPATLNLSGQHATGGAGLSDQRAQADFKIRF